MTDSTLQRVWDSRDAISQRCDYDSHKLIRFYQSRKKTDNQTKPSNAPSDSAPAAKPEATQG